MNPLHLVRESGIRFRVRLLIAIASSGLAVFAAMAFVTIAEVRSGSTAFRQNKLAYEVARDYANPSQSLLSGGVVLHSIRSANDQENIALVKDQIARARAKLEAGHAYYMRSLPPGRLRDLVTGDAYRSASDWNTLAEREYLPAVERGDFSQARKIRIEKLDPLVLKNTAANDEIARLTDVWMASNAAFVERTVTSRRWQLAAVGAATLIIQFVLGLLIDSSVGRSTRLLQQTLEELHRKNDEVESFVYIVSHDLRAPLVNVQGFARELGMSCQRLKSILEPCALPDETRKAVRLTLDEEMGSALKFISASSAKFERLIDALLNLSRQGRQVYDIVPVDVRQVAVDTIDSLQQLIVEAGARVHVGPLPPAQADVTALGQVLSNLIGNSIKYRCRQRPLEVDVGGEINGGSVRYWVRDNGLGIPESGRARLFQVFQRLHPQQAAGEGMGLAIVHRIVERHGGKIWAESQEGKGTTFHFSLPRAPRATAGVMQERIPDGNA